MECQILFLKATTETLFFSSDVHRSQDILGLGKSYKRVAPQGTRVCSAGNFSPVNVGYPNRNPKRNRARKITETRKTARKNETVLGGEIECSTLRNRSLIGRFFKPDRRSHE
jgi:hypothetical protein